jgi:acyl carrier protein
MGLDMVEVIMATEEAFDVEIRDEEAERVRTVGQLYALVIGKLAASETRRCMSSVVFYQARRALTDLCDVPRRSISPSTPMRALLPERRRRTHWGHLGREVGARLPNLELPPWIDQVLLVLTLALLFTCAAAYFTSPLSVAVSYSVGGALLVWTARRAAAPFANRIPAPCATVGGTVRAVLRSNQGYYGPTARKWDPIEAWDTLRRVIAEQLDIPVEAITPEADFIDNLGAD